jgi:hypothetical protein
MLLQGSKKETKQSHPPTDPSQVPFATAIETALTSKQTPPLDTLPKQRKSHHKASIWIMLQTLHRTLGSLSLGAR